MRRVLLWAGALGALVFLAALGLRFLQPAWPEFPPEGGKQPQAQFVVERDYGHRIGDVIEADLYLRLQAGTRLLLSTLAFDGDFELASEPELLERPLPDGGVCYRVKLKLQSFAVEDSLSLAGRFVWSDDASFEQAEFEIPQLRLYRSNTWDGRAELQEGDDPRIPAWWYWGRYLVPLAAAVVVYLWFLAVALWRRRRAGALPPAETVARNRLAELLALVKSGQCTAEGHLEIDAIVRDRFKVGRTVPVAELEQLALPQAAPIGEFLKLNAYGIYPENRLTEEENARLAELGQQVMERGIVFGS